MTGQRTKGSSCARLAWSAQPDTSATPVAEVTVKPVQDRFASETVSAEKPPIAPSRPTTKTAEAMVPTGRVAPAPAQ